MNKFDKIKLFCRKFRIAIGIILILAGIFTGIAWFYLGVIPLIAGLANFCPLCKITKKCTI
ncbi:MAG: YgaP-like transmembrane domain [Arcobacter sp.]|uniref:YgaP-like transmembrane domain n=1 Tax=Arcobacter sp. TaxID=1872629 RepID=UPI003B00A169